jgi:hypothetical protein
MVKAIGNGADVVDFIERARADDVQRSYYRIRCGYFALAGTPAQTQANVTSENYR